MAEMNATLRKRRRVFTRHSQKSTKPHKTCENEGERSTAREETKVQVNRRISKVFKTESATTRQKKVHRRKGSTVG